MACACCSSIQHNTYILFSSIHCVYVVVPFVERKPCVKLTATTAMIRYRHVWSTTITWRGWIGSKQAILHNLCRTVVECTIMLNNIVVIRCRQVSIIFFCQPFFPPPHSPTLTVGILMPHHHCCSRHHNQQQCCVVAALFQHVSFFLFICIWWENYEW